MKNYDYNRQFTVFENMSQKVSLFNSFDFLFENMNLDLKFFVF